MPTRIVPWLLTCAPLAIMLGAWVVLYQRRQAKTLLPIGFIALGFATANAFLAAGTFTYYELRPSVFRPPWEDPEVLHLALLLLLAAVAMVLGGVAVERGAPKWLMGLVELASVPLLVVGFLATMAV